MVKASFNYAKTVCNYIEFVIRGRYFALNLSENTGIDNNKDLWVKVIFTDVNDPSNDLDEYEMLDAFDAKITPKLEEDPYNILSGVDFYNTNPPVDAYQLLEQIDTKLRVPTASQFKFTSCSIENINGGTI